MDVHERINFIMTTERMSAKDFAEILGVQRSSISHLISGRNKPSIDFLEKFISAFPKYNPVWLISGKGEMKLESSTPKQEENKSNSTKTVQKVVQHTLFEQDDLSNLAKNTNIEPIHCGTEPTSVLNIKEQDSVRTTASLDQKSEAIGQKKPSINKIVFFYDDGTFETYSEKPKI